MRNRNASDRLNLPRKQQQRKRSKKQPSTNGKDWHVKRHDKPKRKRGEKNWNDNKLPHYPFNVPRPRHRRRMLNQIGHGCILAVVSLP